MKNNLIITNQNAKVALSKSKSLLDITNKLLSKKDIDKLIQSFKFKPFIKEHNHEKGSIDKVLITKDNKLFITVSYFYGIIKIWDLQTTECLKTLYNRSRIIAVAQDGKYLIINFSNCIEILDLENFELIKSINDSTNISAFCITNNNSYIITAHNTITLWDFKTGDYIKSFKNFNGNIKSLITTPDNKMLISKNSYCSIKIWDIESGDEINSFYSGKNRVQLIAVSSCGNFLISNYGKNIIIHDIYLDENIRTIEAHNDSIDCLILTDSDEYIISSGDKYDNNIKIWDFKTGECIRALNIKSEKHSDYRTHSIGISTDQKYIISTQGDFIRSGDIKIWNFKTGKCLKNLKTYNKEIKSLEWCDNGKSIMSAGGDTKIKIWDIQKGILMDDFTSNTSGKVENITLNTKYNLLFCFNEEDLGSRTIQDLRLFNLKTHDEIWHSKFSNTETSNSAILSPNATHILIGEDKFYRDNRACLRIINLVTKEEKTIVTPNREQIKSIVMTSDEKLLIVCDSWGTYIWDFETLKLLNKIYKKSLFRKGLQLSKDNQLLIITTNKNCYIYNLKNTENISLLEHPCEVSSVSISLDNTKIITGCSNGTLRLWDILTAECIYTISDGHQGSVDSILIHPNKKIFASGGDDGKIMFWNIQSGDYIYTIDHIYETAMDQNGYFTANDVAMKNYIRVSEGPLTQRKLTDAEIKHFRKKEDFLELGKIVPKPKIELAIIEKNIAQDWGISDDEAL